MRNALGLMLASVGAAVVIAAVWFWTSSPRADLTVAATLSAPPAERLAGTASAKPIPIPKDVEVTATIPAKPPVRPQPKAACANPDALGVSRVVEIDTTGGPGFGFEHFKQLDFLTNKEIVLTFDDGPWPVNTPSVLKSLADECTKAVFFPIGKHATYHPEILKQVAAAGHSVGAHTWSHANLNSKKMSEQQAVEEIEKRFQRRQAGAGRSPVAVFSLSATAAWSGDGELSWVAQRRDLLLRPGLI